MNTDYADQEISNGNIFPLALLFSVSAVKIFFIRADQRLSAVSLPCLRDRFLVPHFFQIGCG